MTQHTSASLGSRMLSGAVVISLTQVCVVLLGFLAQREILSALTKDANGLLFVERRIADLILIIVVDFGINGIAMRRLVQFPERTREILSSLLAFRIAVLVPATIFCLVSAYISGYNLADVAMYCLFLAINSRTSLLRYVMELPYRVKVRYWIVSATSILDSLLFAAMVYAWRDSLSPSVVIQALLLSAIPGFIIFLFAGETRGIRLRYVSIAEVRELVTQALPVVLVVILMNVHDKIDALMLEWFTTPEQVGVFGAAYSSLGPISSTIAISLVLAMAPGIARLAIEDFAACRRYAFTAMRFLLVTAVCISTVLSVLTPLIIEILTKGRYRSDHAQFFIFLWMPVPIFLLTFVQDLNVAMGNQSRNIPVAWMLFLGTVILGFAIIPIYGAQGAVIAKLLTLVMASATAIAMFTRILAQPLHLSLILRVLLLIAIGVVLSNVMPVFMPMILAAITSLVIILIMTALLGIVDRTDVMKVKGLLFAARG